MSLVEKINGHFREIYLHYGGNRLSVDDIEDAELAIVGDVEEVEEYLKDLRRDLEALLTGLRHEKELLNTDLPIELESEISFLDSILDTLNEKLKEV